MTLPRDHAFRGMLSSITSTRSSSFKFFCGFNHFFLELSNATNSFCQRLQMQLTCCWTTFQRCRGDTAVLCEASTSMAKGGSILPTRKWFGVSTASSCGSSDNAASGRLLSMPSASTNAVSNSSSRRSARPITDVKALLAHRIIASNTPPWCGDSPVVRGARWVKLPLKSLLNSFLVDLRFVQLRNGFSQFSLSRCEVRPII